MPGAGTGTPATKPAKVVKREAKSTRSRSGCLTCRQRKIKCDEGFSNGTCQNCARLKRQCRQGSTITFRNEQNPSFERASDRLHSFYSYRDTFGPNTVWLHVPEDLHFVEVEAWKIRGRETEEYDQGEEDAIPIATRLKNLRGQYDQLAEYVGLQALSEAAIANQQASAYEQELPYDGQQMQDMNMHASNQQLVDQHQQMHQHQHPDMPTQLDPQAYVHDNMDYILRDAAAQATQIDPDLERLTRSAADAAVERDNVMSAVELVNFLGQDTNDGGHSHEAAG